MKIIDKYIIKNFILTFLFVLLVLAVIALVIDYTEKVNDFVEHKLSVFKVLKYYCQFIPFITVFLFPIFVFIAVIFFTTRLTARSEVIAMLNSGMSFNRFLLPYAIVGVFLGLVLLYLNNYAIPILNKGRIAFENTYIINNPNTTKADMHFRISKTEFVYIKGFSPQSKNGYNFCYEKIENNKLLYKLWAENIQWDSIKKEWILNTITIRTNEGEKESLQNTLSKRKKYNFTPADIIEVYEQKSAMTTPELQRFINKEKSKGNPALAVYEVEKHRRLGAPFSMLVLTILGASMASLKTRGGSGVHLALGISISGAYVIAMQFSTTFSIKGNLSPIISVWIPNVIFSILTLLIYNKYKK
jgi:lipopolysaccharide export system permease protein